ncbi:MAG: Asp-tRNA(Asn)/Glu-tRNA(Gln) amidotransferase subunit GatB [bacterium]|nr:Asp-tRNA(Asn)/Glu-tRNA(Gln) amidotransferase subunit GatB [bacterium]
MYKPTIGLEIHSELKTRSKMFCASPNNPDETRPNFNVCPICLGHPGTLPVINEEAVKSVIKLGLAVAGKIPLVSRFDRKSYFYPDLPKGYQISQYKQPLVEGGTLNGVKITRVHLEEDTGTLSHDKENHSLVDFNRAGVPLMELVTEPDIRSGEEAVAFAKELQLILRYLDISEANMEKGQMRVEVNISLREIADISMNQFDNQHESASTLGTKVEVKNLNSFKSVKEAVDYEIKRQTEILEEGKQVIHETRGWDDVKRITVSQRSKEKAHDYRYFPEPDLPPLDLVKFNIKELKDSLPELPAAKRNRFEKEYGLTLAQAEILIEDNYIAGYFEKAVKELKLLASDYKPQVLFNYLTSDFFGLITEQGISLKESKINPRQLAELTGLIIENKISSRIAKDVLGEMFLSGLNPRQIIQEKGLSQISDEAIIKKTIEEVIMENSAALSDYRKGKANALQFLIGQAMKKLKGQANPEILKNLFEESLR